MTHSVLTKVTNKIYKGQKFYMYKNTEPKITTLTEVEAIKLKELLDKYPNIFTETEVIPRSKQEIKLLLPEDFLEQDGQPLTFDFGHVEEDCTDLLDQLEDNFDDAIIGIDREETVKQTFKN
ncbi:hypothetical protein FW781_09265 (plasmid) [Chryseobacterium panacisoli]|uniref:Uncharacterized protein n=1 Tax=Chryseobacterium panacisoli TaxID=1807141 RepID=A0A5D9A0R5_9FLAO|nr:hypothetical protein [Chryseobacterium panacisoli]TZG00097.1 hypothetical protein FW781_09265 [Chryseobacterium panacisoli]